MEKTPEVVVFFLSTTLKKRICLIVFVQVFARFKIKLYICIKKCGSRWLYFINATKIFCRVNRSLRNSKIAFFSIVLSICIQLARISDFGSPCPQARAWLRNLTHWILFSFVVSYCLCFILHGCFLCLFVFLISNLMYEIFIKPN